MSLLGLLPHSVNKDIGTGEWETVRGRASWVVLAGRSNVVGEEMDW